MKNFIKKYIFTITIVILIIISISLGFTSKNGHFQEKKQAEENCKQLVLDRLSAPSTAVWGKFDEYKKSRSDIFSGSEDVKILVLKANLFDTIIKGTVDSQNGFGGMRRTDFVCLTDENLSDGGQMKLVTDSDDSIYNRIIESLK